MEQCKGKPESCKDATTNVLDGPEVKREEKNYEDKASDETVREPPTQKVHCWGGKIHHYCPTNCNNVVSIQDSFIDLLLFLGDETMILYFETNEIVKRWLGT